MMFIIEPDTEKWKNVEVDFASGGHLDLLRKYCNFDETPLLALASSACMFGKLEVFAFLCERDSNLVSCATETTSIEILEYAEKLGLDLGKIQICGHHQDNFELIKFLYSRGAQNIMDATCLENAAKISVESLEWAFAHGAPLTPRAFVNAIRSLNWENILWLKKHDCPVDTLAFQEAAVRGDFKLLTWMKENSFPWEESVCTRAATIGKISVLKWLRAHGCPWSVSACSAASARGHLKLLKWILAQGFEINRSLINDAAVAGHLHIIQWFFEQKITWEVDSSRKTAFRKQWHVLAWLITEKKIEYDNITFRHTKKCLDPKMLEIFRKWKENATMKLPSL